MANMPEPLSPTLTAADSDAASSVALNLTQTEQHDQEPFEQFRPKVEKLCRQLWPSAGRIELERIAGGANNRTIAVTVFPKDLNSREGKNAFKMIKRMVKWVFRKLGRLLTMHHQKQSAPSSTELKFSKFILRIPRNPADPEESTLHEDRAACEFAARLTTTPVPKFVKVDLESDNPIESPYVIQHFVAGRLLEELWSDLNQDQRQCAAKLVGRLLRDLTSTTYSAAGTVDPRDISKILALPKPGFSKLPNKTELAQLSKPSQLMRDRFAGWNKNHAHNQASYPYCALAKLIRDDMLGPDSKYYFCHGDLYPRNIMARVVDEDNIEITGILDWDTAGFAPAIVAFEIPCWLWRMESYWTGELEDFTLRIGAADEPEKDEDRQVKKVFEEAVGEDWLRVAYMKDAEVLRWIWRFSVEGVCDSTYWGLAEEAINELTGQPFETSKGQN